MQAQEDRETGLEQRMRRLQEEHDQSLTRLAQLEATRKREAEMLNEFVQQGINLQDYVSRDALNQRLKELDDEYMRELESTTDVFMPQTKIKEALSKQSAEIDELRRLIQQDDGRRKRYWDDNLQTFLDDGPIESLSARSTPHGSTRNSPLLGRRPNRRASSVNPVSRIAHALASRKIKSMDERPLNSTSVAPLQRTSSAHQPLSLGGSETASAEASEDEASEVALSTTDASAPIVVPVAVDSTAPVTVQDEVDELAQMSSELHEAQVKAAAKLDRTRRTLEKSRYRDSLHANQEELTFMLRQGKFRELDPTAVDVEDWMNDPELCRQLQLHQVEYDRLEDARSELQQRIADLQARQRANPSDLTFQDKLAFFATAAKMPTANTTSTAQPQSSGQPMTSRALVKGSMGVKYDHSNC